MLRFAPVVSKEPEAQVYCEGVEQPGYSHADFNKEFLPIFMDREADFNMLGTEGIKDSARVFAGIPPSAKERKEVIRACDALYHYYSPLYPGVPEQLPGNQNFCGALAQFLDNPHAVLASQWSK